MSIFLGWSRKVLALFSGYQALKRNYANKLKAQVRQVCGGLLRLSSLNAPVSEKPTQKGTGLFQDKTNRKVLSLLYCSP
jgi:hypothetical protein